ITGAEMMMSGINIGIDIMGASLNTLILAYVGSSMHLLMLFYTYNNPMVMIINDEMIACELLRALAGSCGLLLTVPITSFVSAAMMSKGKFGKLTPDCFATFVAVKKVFTAVKKFFTRPAEQYAVAEAAKEPENLYQNAVKHRIDMEDSGENME
ncbi:MAG: YibE/F family protein, partial [Clostridia bacterium]|nr:YibE/F family protein [Clostridia bacterium]